MTDYHHRPLGAGFKVSDAIKKINEETEALEAKMIEGLKAQQRQDKEDLLRNSYLANPGTNWWNGSLWEKPYLGNTLPVRKSPEPIRGWRWWRLASLPPHAGGGFVLRSTTRHTIWEGPVLRADYPPVEHPNMFGGPGHGIYAFNELQTLADAYYIGDVSGSVLLSGRVICHTLGYRAEVAQIESLRVASPLYVRYSHKAIISSLEDRYQCTVTLDKQEEEL